VKPETQSYSGIEHDDSWFELMGEELEAFAMNLDVRQMSLFLAQLVSTGNLHRSGDSIELDVRGLDGYGIYPMNLSAEQVFLLRQVEDAVHAVERAISEAREEDDDEN
jgi:hypothetical protein